MTMTGDPTQTAGGRISIGQAPMDAEHLKVFRVDIRRMMNSMPMTGPSRYNSLAYTSLEFAAMWLGKVLGAIGEPYPYTEKTAQPVEDSTLDTYASNNPAWDRILGSEKLSNSRNLIGQWVNQIVTWIEGLETVVEKDKFRKIYQTTMALNGVYTHLCEARMSLGMELGITLKQEQLTHTPQNSIGN